MKTADVPYVEPEVFEQKVESYRQENKLVNALINQLGSWERFAPHLIQDLFVRVGCKPNSPKY